MIVDYKMQQVDLFESPFLVMKRLQKYILDMHFTNFVKIKRFETSIVWLTSMNH